MSTYIAKWPNGDFSIVSGKNRLAIDMVLDEEGDPGCVELIPLKHAVAVHFGLKDKVDGLDVMNECFEFGRLDEESTFELSTAYPHLYSAFDENAEGGITAEKVQAAMEVERDRIGPKPELSDDPQLADLQNAMGISKRMAEKYKKIAETHAAKEQKM